MSKFDESKASGPHFQLSRMAGTWEGVSRVWFDPARVEDEAPVRGTMRLVLGGRFLMHEYETSFKGEPITGMAFIGYHTGLAQYQVAWIDSFHNGTALMFSEGPRGGSDMSVLGSYVYADPEGEQKWGWRTAIDIRSDDEVVFTAWNISPQGEEQKATELVYRRVGA